MIATKSDNPGELLTLVDEHGQVTGSASRSVCHGGSMLLHAVVHLHIINSRGELYLQKRPDWKDVQPGKWDTAVGGHVDYGESVGAALAREVMEEVGIAPGEYEAVALEPYTFRSAVEHEYVNPFFALYDGELHPSAELAGGRFFTVAELDSPEGAAIFTPNFLSEYRRFRSQLPVGER